MIPVEINNTFWEDDKVSKRETVVRVLGCVWYKKVETYYGDNTQRAIGFTGPGVALTEITDEE